MDRSAVTLHAAFCLSVFIAQACSSTLEVTSSSSTQSTSQNICFLPQSPEFGSYTTPICQSNNTAAECRQVPGTSVPHNWVLSFKCNNGYYFTETKEDKFYVFCDNGNWAPKIPVCRMVEVNKSTSSQISVSQPSDSVLSTSNVNQGDKIICGKKKTTITSFGSTNDSPWHVGIYFKNNTGHWTQKCLGTLISPHIVTTVAHYVYSEDLKKNISPEDVKVGIGKYYREWTHEEQYAIKSDVRDILIHPRYLGHKTIFAMDIALLDLPFSVEINENIMPACVDWNHQFTLTPGMLGMLAGFGKTKSETPSDVLLYDELPYIDYRDCIFRLPSKYRITVTPEQFCADSDGTGMMPGYGGGGLTFVHNDLHYLHGITKNILKGAENLIGLINVNSVEILNWITDRKRYLDEIHEEI